MRSIQKRVLGNFSGTICILYLKLSRLLIAVLTMLLHFLVTKLAAGNVCDNYLVRMLRNVSRKIEKVNLVVQTPSIVFVLMFV